MEQASTSWLGAGPVVVTALLVVVAPGWLASRLLGVRGLAALAVAPALSVSTLSLAGVGASMIGVRWGPVPLVGGFLLLWLIAAVVGWRLGSVTVPPTAIGPALAALAVAIAGIAVVVLPVTGSPEAFPQHPDTIFHLGVARGMVESGDISSLHAAGFTSTTGTGFYPAAFHALVVVVAQISGASVVVSASAVALVIAAVVWPLGCLLLARHVLGPGGKVLLAAAVMSAAFSAFPFWLLGYGVLWPLLLGYALLPAALACLLAALGSEAADGLLRWRGLLLFLAALPGVLLGHPNAFIGLLAFGYLAVSERALLLSWQRRRHDRRAAVALVAALLACTLAALAFAAVVTRDADLMRLSNPAGPEKSLRNAVLETLLHGPRGGPRLWVLGVVVAIGPLVLLLRHRAQSWLLASLGLSAALYVMVVAVDSPRTRLLTWPWYNNPPRLAALIVVPAVFAGAATLVALSDLVERLSAGTRAQGWWPALVAPVIFVLVTGGYVDEHRAMINGYFHPPPSRSFATASELDALRELAPDIPEDAVVAANPWNGANYLYVVSGRSMLFPTEKTLTPGDRDLLARRLDEVGTSPEVCQAARRLHVRYAITGGRPFRNSARSFRRYDGIDAVGSSAAFRQVARAGPYRLFERTRCAQR